MAVRERDRQSRPARAETLSAIAVLVALIAIGVAVWRQQYRFDPGLFDIQLTQSAQPAGGGKSAEAAPAMDFAQFLPEGFKAMGPAETFDKDTLSDKIDGKAELYLDCGFEGLTCQRFAKEGKPDAWFEAFVYDMGKPLNAFAVFSNQRRSDGRESDAAMFAYSAGGSVFLSEGKYYLETVPAGQSPELAAGLDAFVRRFAKAQAGSPSEASVFAGLPPDGLIKSTVKLTLKDAFGYDKFDNVISADYNVAGTTVTAFISVRDSAEESTALAEGYYKLLTGSMGGDAAETTGIPVANAKAASLLGDLEVVFASGKTLAGVHAARSREAATALLAKFGKALGNAK